MIWTSYELVIWTNTRVIFDLSEWFIFGIVMVSLLEMQVS